jgi:hypothetical protein
VCHQHLATFILYPAIGLKIRRGTEILKESNLHSYILAVLTDDTAFNKISGFPSALF